MSKYMLKSKGKPKQMLQRMEAQHEINNPYTTAAQNKQEEMQKLFVDPLMDDSEK